MPNSNFHRLSDYCSIKLVGSGTLPFLKGQLTINADLLGSETAKLAAFCNHKGRIISLFHIVKINNGVRLLLPKSLLESSLLHIKKYAVFFDLEIISNEALDIIFSSSNECPQKEVVKVHQTDLSLIFDLDKTFYLESSLDFNKSESALGNKLWYWHLADRDIPWLSSETVEQFLPHYLNLPKLGAIDFKKGCFTGQEIIARMQYKGKLKQEMVSLITDRKADITPLMDIQQNLKKVGQVICSVNLSNKECLVLALIKNSTDYSKDFQLILENASILELTLKS